MYFTSISGVVYFAWIAGVADTLCVATSNSSTIAGIIVFNKNAFFQKFK
jgi:hypothetical protein